LVHPKNHHLDGRKLVVEYASADAVRRGGGAGPRPNKVSSGVAAESKVRRERREPVAGNRGGEMNTLLETSPLTPEPRDDKSMDSSRRSGASKKVGNGTRKSRPAPGAALALAKRERVAIVASQGRRITFDD
jgi:hypothetical protein